MKPRTRKGIAYFRTLQEAELAYDKIVREFPNARIVEYEIGFAVQLRVSGDYLGPDLRPSLS